MKVAEDGIGRRVRDLRQTRGLTLQELADKARLSKSYLSRVETSDKAPPVSTLLTLAQVLGTTVGRLLGEEETSEKISIVKKGARPEVTKDGTAFGYSYSCLIQGYPEKGLEAYVLTLPKEIGPYSPFEHKGEELLFVLRGEIAFLYGGMDYYLEEGDCIYFDSTVPHFGRAVGGDEAQLLCVFISSGPESRSK